MRLKNFPFYKQLDIMDCGPTCIRMIAKFYGNDWSIEYLRKKANITKEGVSLGGIAEAAESIGFHTLAVYIDFETLKKEMPLPCIAFWRQKHFVVVYEIRKRDIIIGDPAHGIVKLSINEFVNGWIGKNDSHNKEGYLLLVEPTPLFYEKEVETNKKPIGLKFLMKYIKPYKKLVIQLAVGLFVGSLLQLIFPFLTQAVVDYGINYENLNFVYLILIAQLTLFISQSAVDLIRSWILMHITNRVNINLISDFLMKLMKLPIAFFDSKNTGDIIQRIYDHKRVQTFLSSNTLSTIFSVFNVIVFGIVLIYYHIGIFLIFMTGSLLYIGWTLMFLRKRKELDYRMFDESAENQNSVHQLITGMQEIKLNGSERRRRWEWESIQVRIFKISIKSLTLSQTQTAGGRFLNEFKNIIITFIAAKSVIEGELTLGMMLSVQYIIGQMNIPIDNFISFIQIGQDAKISLERLSEVHSKDDEEKPEKNTTDSLPDKRTIIFNNVSFRYGGKSSPWVLRKLNFTIEEGKVTAIVGASGSGKTTLIKLLLKFYLPTKGNIRVGNVDIDDLNTRMWRKSCGSVMQDGFIFGDTISRNITESDSEGFDDEARLYNAVKVSNIHDFINEQPSGFNTKIGSAGVNISGGQKQRILIARAVYKSPDFIFFDEATSALDTNNEKVIMENLQEFYRGRTVVVVAHRLSTVKNADNIIVLDKGEVIERGTHEKLIGNKSVYYSLVKNQLELGD